MIDRSDLDSQANMTQAEWLEQHENMTVCRLCGTARCFTAASIDDAISTIDEIEEGILKIGDA